MSTGPGLVIVGHGTKSDDGVAEFGRFVGLVAKLAPFDVAGGFLELSAPPLTDAVAGLYDRGHRRLVAVPLVLVGAGHAKGDVPAALARERERRPGLSFGYGRPLGPHPTLLEILDERIAEVLLPDERAGTAVVLVGRGATDPDANADIAKTARLLYEGRGFLTVETSFVSLADPSVPVALERARLLGARRILVSPYFLFSGVLPDRVGAQALAWAAEHPDVEVRVAGVLGPDERIARLVLDRYTEVLTGDVRMSCDTCLYRIALPGYESRVGAPQLPHHHPDDPAHHHHHYD
ncbi:MAG: sirohydrochlorin cobaltochelatase [Frankiales bacterium]|nr:sirohydrochlorin cobaltochelatase [Frankiales bacterium]MDX6223417.1 sirohydrochlorin cobaltochelatase [Frankiales bacterium]